MYTYRSPTPFHVEQILAAVEKGKHVFCEKPISNDLKAIDTCIKVRRARDTGGAVSPECAHCHGVTCGPQR